MVHERALLVNSSRISYNIWYLQKKEVSPSIPLPYDRVFNNNIVLALEPYTVNIFNILAPLDDKK